MLARIKFLTSGESHGRGLLGIIDGLPAGLEIDEDYIRIQLARRQMGYGRGGRMKIEKDHAEIWSGVRHGKTLGSPIGLLVHNRDWENWTKKMSVEPIEDKIKIVKKHYHLCSIKSFLPMYIDLWTFMIILLIYVILCRFMPIYEHLVYRKEISCN